jgi:transcription elongation GreA/GreB family factor
MREQRPGEVTVGTWVKVTGFVPGEEEVFHLVPEGETDYYENKIPPTSPLAVALAGAQEGDRVSFHPPAGEVELTVLEVGPR